MGKKFRARLRIGAVIAVGALAAWFVLTNLFLNFVLPGLLNRRPERLRVQYRSAWMVLPGRISVRGLELRGQNRSFQWHAVLDRGRGRVELRTLARREFVLDRFRGRGLEVRLRRRAAAGQPSPDGAPPIPGLSNPPDPAPEDLYPPRKARWRLLFRDTRIDEIRDVWIEEYRFEGASRSSGTIEVRPRRSVRLEGVVYEIGSGGIRHGETPVTEELAGEMQWDLPEMDLRESSLLEAFARGSISLRLESRSGALDFLDNWLEKLPNVSLSGGGGKLTAGITMEDGRLRGGSYVRAEGNDLRFSYLHTRVTGTGRVAWEVLPDTPSAEFTTLTVDLDTLNVTSGPSQEPQASGGSFHATVRTNDLLPLDGVDGLELELRLQDATVADFDVYNIYLPADAPFRWESGSARLEAELKADRTSGTGWVRLRAEDLLARYEDVDLRGNLDLHAKVEDLNLDQQTFSLAGSTLRIFEGSVSPAGKTPSKEEKDWWADLELEKGRLRIGRSLDIDVTATAQLRDTLPIVEVFAQERALVRVFQPLFKVRDVEAAGRFRMDDRSLRLTDLTASGQRLDVRGCLRSVGKDQDGAFYAKRSVLQSSLEIADGRRRLRPLKPVKWWREQGVCAAIERQEAYPAK